MLRRAVEVGLLSARGEHRTVRVARTIADLAGNVRIASEHMAEALAFGPTSPTTAPAARGSVLPA